MAVESEPRWGERAQEGFGRRRENFCRAYDPMIRPMREVAVEPRRVVVELEPAEFEALDKACGRVAPADYLRLIALRLLAAESPSPKYSSRT
jgi:hypothetical protein